MKDKAVSNTGPIIHLTEIDLLKVLDIFSSIMIPEEVASELKRNKIQIPSRVKITKLISTNKDTVKLLTNQKDLDSGEAEAIALSIQEKPCIFLTDDLEARVVAKELGIETHGTVGIILRAFKNKLIEKNTAIEKIRSLHSLSSLFITRDLIEKVISSINEFSKS